MLLWNNTPRLDVSSEIPTRVFYFNIDIIMLLWNVVMTSFITWDAAKPPSTKVFIGVLVFQTVAQVGLKEVLENCQYLVLWVTKYFSLNLVTTSLATTLVACLPPSLFSLSHTIWSRIFSNRFTLNSYKNVLLLKCALELSKGIKSLRWYWLHSYQTGLVSKRNSKSMKREIER